MSVIELGSLTERFRLDRAAEAALSRYAQMLASDPLAPTTVRAPAAVRDDHLADSLVALELEAVTSADAIADIGAGAGLPGLVLAAALPSCHVTLLDSVNKKCEFMRAASARMGLENTTVVHARAEEYHGSFDVVTARALAPLDVLAEYAAPLLRLGGHLVAWRGKREAEVEADGVRAAEILGLSVQEPVRVEPYPTAAHRYLHLMCKVKETPHRFPRRPGMARKRPLGAL